MTLDELSAALAQAERVAARTRATSDKIDAIPNAGVAATWGAWRIAVEAEMARYDLALRFQIAAKWQNVRAA